MLLIIDNKQQYGLPVFNTTVYPHLVRRLKIVPLLMGLLKLFNIFISPEKNIWLKLRKNVGLIFLRWMGDFSDFFFLRKDRYYFKSMLLRNRLYCLKSLFLMQEKPVLGPLRLLLL